MKSIRILFVLAGLLLGGHFTGRGQVFEWATMLRIQQTNTSRGQGATTDPAGNTYVVSRGGAILKLDSTGRQLWSRPVQNVYFFSGRRSPMRADPANGGFFIAGVLAPGATWNGIPIPGAPPITGNPDATAGFYGKCDASGTLVWARPYLADPNGPPQMAVDELGNCYLSGTFCNVFPRLRPGTLGGKAIDTTAAFLLGNNAAGTAEWVRRVRATPVPYVSIYNPGNPCGVGLNLGSKAGGGCMLFGVYKQTLLVENAAGTFVPLLQARTPVNTPYDDFVALLTPVGNLTWTRPGRAGQPTALSTPVPTAQAVAADSVGNYYVTGYFTTFSGGLGYARIGLSTAKYGPAGNLLWTTNQDVNTSITSNTALGLDLVVDRRDEATVLVQVDNMPNFPTVPVGGNLVLRTDPFGLLHYNAAGVPTWATALRSGRPDTPLTYTASGPVALGVDAKGNVYYTFATGTFSASNPGGQGLEPAVTLAGDQTIVGAGILVARIGTRHNTVRGRVYLDANGNGRRDAGEGPFPQQVVLQVVQATYAPLGTFDTDGQFNVYAGRGAYSLAPPPAPLHYALSEPANGLPYTGSFSGFGGVDTARTFGYRPLAAQTDLRATLTPYGAARPGFLTRYRLTLANVGTTPVPAGTANVTLDARAQLVSTTPAFTRQLGPVVSIPYPAVPLFGRTELDVLFSLPTNTPLGTVLRSSALAALPADVAPADNTDEARQTVTGSYDPNDITVNYQRLSPAQVAAGQPLDYTIRFQNMGTDTAFTVVIKDTLNFRKLNLGSLMLVAQSHNCLWSLSGQGELTVRFLNIRLPHRGIDVIRSQGFVRFRVLPKPSLAVGDIIPNRASVVFDYNAPVRTNTATTAVLLPTAVAAARPGLAWEVYPNPATAAVYIAAELPTGGPVSLLLLDALGRPVRRQHLLAPAGPLRETLAVQGLAPGVYVLQVALPDGTVSKRVVVE